MDYPMERESLGFICVNHDVVDKGYLGKLKLGPVMLIDIFDLTDRDQIFYGGAEQIHSFYKQWRPNKRTMSVKKIQEELDALCEWELLRPIDVNGQIIAYQINQYFVHDNTQCSRIHPENSCRDLPDGN